MSGSARAVKQNSPTGCSRRCDTSLAGTWKKRDEAEGDGPSDGRDTQDSLRVNGNRVCISEGQVFLKCESSGVGRVVPIIDDVTGAVRYRDVNLRGVIGSA